MSITIKANSIIGLPVITLTEGKNIHKVKEVVYDARSNKVKAIVVDEKGWFSDAKIILIESIHSIGKDAVIVNNQLAVVDADEQNNKVVSSIVNDDNFLTRSEVITENGKKLGRVTDIYFTFPGGIVTDIEVSEGFVKGIGSGSKKIRITDLITVGEDNLIVKDYVEDVFEVQGKDQGLNKVISDTKENVSNIAQVTSNKVQETVKSDPVQNAVQKTQEVASNIKDAVIEKFTEVKQSVESGELQKNVGSTVETVKEKTGNIIDSGRQNVTQTTQNISASATEDRIHKSVGKKVGDIVLLTKDDKIMATPGDVVTHNLVQKAKDEGNLDKLLDNTNT
jgi:uncharacterized protein YrrD